MGGRTCDAAEEPRANMLAVVVVVRIGRGVREAASRTELAGCSPDRQKQQLALLDPSKPARRAVLTIRMQKKRFVKMDIKPENRGSWRWEKGKKEWDGVVMREV